MILLSRWFYFLLPRQVVNSLSLEDQGQVGWGPGQPELIPMAGDWNWKVFKIPSNPT